MRIEPCPQFEPYNIILISCRLYFMKNKYLQERSFKEISIFKFSVIYPKTVRKHKLNRASQNFWKSEGYIFTQLQEYWFDQLGLGIRKEIGLVVMFHRDPSKNFIIRSLLFEKYAQAIVCNVSLFREAFQLLKAQDELSLKLVLICQIGEMRFEHTRGILSQSYISAS